MGGKSRSSMMNGFNSSSRLWSFTSADAVSVFSVEGGVDAVASQFRVSPSISISSGAKCAVLWNGESLWGLGGANGVCVGAALSMSKLAALNGNGVWSAAAVAPVRAG